MIRFCRAPAQSTALVAAPAKRQRPLQQEAPLASLASHAPKQSQSGEAVAARAAPSKLPVHRLAPKRRTSAAAATASARKRKPSPKAATPIESGLESDMDTEESDYEKQHQTSSRLLVHDGDGGDDLDEEEEEPRRAVLTPRSRKAAAAASPGRSGGRAHRELAVSTSAAVPSPSRKAGARKPARSSAPAAAVALPVPAPASSFAGMDDDDADWEGLTAAAANEYMEEEEEFREEVYEIDARSGADDGDDFELDDEEEDEFEAQTFAAAAAQAPRAAPVQQPLQQQQPRVRGDAFFGGNHVPQPSMSYTPAVRRRRQSITSTTSVLTGGAPHASLNRRVSTGPGLDTGAGVSINSSSSGGGGPVYVRDQHSRAGRGGVGAQGFDGNSASGDASRGIRLAAGGAGHAIDERPRGGAAAAATGGGGGGVLRTAAGAVSNGAASGLLSRAYSALASRARRTLRKPSLMTVAGLVTSIGVAFAMLYSFFNSLMRSSGDKLTDEALRLLREHAGGVLCSSNPSVTDAAAAAASLALTPIQLSGLLEAKARALDPVGWAETLANVVNVSLPAHASIDTGELAHGRLGVRAEAAQKPWQCAAKHGAGSLFRGARAVAWSAASAALAVARANPVYTLLGVCGVGLVLYAWRRRADAALVAAMVSEAREVLMQHSENSDGGGRSGVPEAHVRDAVIDELFQGAPWNRRRARLLWPAVIATLAADSRIARREEVGLDGQQCAHLAWFSPLKSPIIAMRRVSVGGAGGVVNGSGGGGGGRLSFGGGGSGGRFPQQMGAAASGAGAGISSGNNGRTSDGRAAGAYVRPTAGMAAPSEQQQWTGMTAPIGKFKF